MPCGVFGGFRVIIDKHFVARVLILTRQNVIIKKRKKRKSWHSHFVTWFNPSTKSKISKRLVKEPHISLRDQTTAKPGGSLSHQVLETGWNIHTLFCVCWICEFQKAIKCQFVFSTFSANLKSDVQYSILSTKTASDVMIQPNYSTCQWSLHCQCRKKLDRKTHHGLVSPELEPQHY